MGVVELGEIRRGETIGKNTGFKYIWHACEECGKERWVSAKRGKPVALRCGSCALKGNGLGKGKVQNLTLNTAKPALGETRYGKELGKKDYQAHFIWSACIDCGKERWVLLYKDNPHFVRCRPCARKRRFEISRAIIASKPPQVGEIRSARELGWLTQRGKMRMFRICPECSEEHWICVEHTKQPNYTGLCIECARKLRRGKQWKESARHKVSGGYIKISILPSDPFYPMAKLAGRRRDENYIGYLMEHRLVMAKHLGRCLEKSELVHHLNGVRDDNRIKNLALVTTNNHPRHTFSKLLQKHIRELEAESAQGNMLKEDRELSTAMDVEKYIKGKLG